MKEKEICNILKNLGILPSYKGYRYLTKLTQLAIDGELLIGMMPKIGYPKLAKEYRVTPVSVERACRTAINRTYDMYPELYFDLLKIRSRPSNSELVFTLADLVSDY